MTFKAGSVAMITGTGGCIGKKTALMLAQNGIKTVLCDVSAEPLKPLAEEIRSIGGETLCCVFDVRDYEGVCKAARETKRHFGHIDDLICVAGGSAALINKLSDFVDSEPPTWEYVMRLNVQGSFNCVHAVLPSMIERQSGRIILFGSIAGVCGLAKRADYSAAKGAISSFTKALAMEVGKYNIAVNCVSPGAIHRGTEPMEGMTYMGPKGLSSGPEPVAAMCLYLCSEEAGFITGQEFQVDGGRTLGAR